MTLHRLFLLAGWALVAVLALYSPWWSAPIAAFWLAVTGGLWHLGRTGHFDTRRDWRW